MISPHVGGKVLPTGKSFSTLFTAAQRADMNNETGSKSVHGRKANAKNEEAILQWSLLEFFLSVVKR